MPPFPRTFQPKKHTHRFNKSTHIGLKLYGKKANLHHKGTQGDATSSAASKIARGPFCKAEQESSIRGLGGIAQW